MHLVGTHTQIVYVDPHLLYSSAMLIKVWSVLFFVLWVLCGRLGARLMLMLEVSVTVTLPEAEKWCVFVGFLHTTIVHVRANVLAFAMCSEPTQHGMT